MFRAWRLVATATVLFVAAGVVRAVLAYGPTAIGDPADWPVTTVLLLPSLRP